VDAERQTGRNGAPIEETTMSVLEHRATTTAAVTTAPTTATSSDPTRSAALRGVLAAIRLSLGWIFLWAFVDKLFGLGFATPSERSWLNGGSPTKGFLANAATGPFEGLYKSIAGATWADWLFMTGLAGIGIALIAGIAMRIATASGALLLVLMWTAVLPPENNPFMDDHIVYALVLVALALTGAGRYFGLGRTWERLAIVQKYPVLK
jgi:thiosulfate dehydrogenase [quinone] large subunit